MRALFFLLLPLAFAAGKKPVPLTIDQSSVPSTKVGTAVEVPITISIARDFHVQANPASQENLIPLQLHFEGLPSGFALESITYPAGKPFQVKSTSKPLATYDGEIRVTAKFRVAANAQPGDRELKGVARFQPCTQETCLFPTNQEFSVLVKVGRP